MRLGHDVMTLRGTSRQQRCVPEMKKTTAYAALYWSELITFYQRISRVIFKICFSRSWLPSQATKQTNFGNFACPQMHFGCPKPLGKCYTNDSYINSSW